MVSIKITASRLNGDFKPLYKYTVLTLGALPMYLTNEKKEKIAALFSNYALWSDRRHAQDENDAYAIKVQAQCIVDLIGLGIPHHLEPWAIGVLADPFFIDAEYSFNESI